MQDPGIWYVSIQGHQQGPIPTQQVIQGIQGGSIPRDAWVCGAGMTQWSPITSVSALAPAFSHQGWAPPPPPAGPAAAHEIDYELFGAEMQYVEITLDPGEACISEAGAMFWMDPDIQMETVFGDGSPGQQQAGFLDKMMSAGKRVLTGESLFMTVFMNAGGTRRKVAFAAPYPGKIVPVDLRQHGGLLICQKDAFLCAAKGISIGIALQKKLGVGFFGGEGFIMQKLEGQGLAFIHAGGTLLERTLAPGETLRLDTGCLVALEQQVTYDIQLAGGVKTALFGGEGLFLATLTGPGRIWLQSLPFSRLAGRVLSAGFGRSREEGSVLGGFGLG
jgi:uncharacterized protein (TIGR00266 family)